MANVSRDVLIVSRLSGMSEKALEKEYRQISQLLYSVETIQQTAITTEIIDTARFKIIRKPHKIVEAFRQRYTTKPFVFVFNKN